jgi:two-component system chemotaxis response regulator CheB
MWEIQDGSLLRFRCRVGHAFTAESMVAGQDDNVEEALWMALNTLEESEQLYTRLAQQAYQHHHPRMEEQFRRKVQAIEKRASVLREVLTGGPQVAESEAVEASD